jgi:hypothetical protein
MLLMVGLDRHDHIVRASVRHFIAGPVESEHASNSNQPDGTFL